MPDETYRTVDVTAWVERVRPDPAAHRQRQATELVLNAVAMCAPYGAQLLLKGGVLMGLAYDSPRQTTDIDLTATFEATEDTAEEIRTALNGALARARIQLGYDLLAARVQKVAPQPRSYPHARFPALEITVGYAAQGTAQERQLAQGKAANTVAMDISFNEETHDVQILELTGGQSLWAYGLLDLVAEKYRAMLQQVARDRARRQDVYDLHRLIAAGELDQADGAALHEIFIAKCLSRGIVPVRDALNDPEVRRRSAAEWNTLALELGELPSFEVCYEAVAAFYQGLPWK